MAASGGGSSSHSLKINMHNGRYEREVHGFGRGTFGEVFEAVRTEERAPSHPTIHGSRRVCLKLVGIPGDDLSPEHAREIELWSSLDHPNIAPLRDWFVDTVPAGRTSRKVLGLVTDLYEYGSLRNVLKKDAELRSGSLPGGRPHRPFLSTRRMFLIAKGVLEGLDFLHSRNPAIVHRDLKPENVCLGTTSSVDSVESADGTPCRVWASEDSLEVRIIDFGTSEERFETLVSSGTVGHGTLAYMGPQRTGRGRYSACADDCWAAGLLLAECLLGEGIETLFPSVRDARVGDEKEVLRAKLPCGRPEEVAMLVYRCESVDGALGKVIRGLLEVDEGARWTSARALGELEAATSGMGKLVIGKQQAVGEEMARLLVAVERVLKRAADAEERAARAEEKVEEAVALAHAARAQAMSAEGEARGARAEASAAKADATRATEKATAAEARVEALERTVLELKERFESKIAEIGTQEPRDDVKREESSKGRGDQDSPAVPVRVRRHYNPAARERPPARDSPTDPAWGFGATRSPAGGSAVRESFFSSGAQHSPVIAEVDPRGSTTVVSQFASTTASTTGTLHTDSRSSALRGGAWFGDSGSAAYVPPMNTSGVDAHADTLVVGTIGSGSASMSAGVVTGASMDPSDSGSRSRKWVSGRSRRVLGAIDATETTSSTTTSSSSASSGGPAQSADAVIDPEAAPAAPADSAPSTAPRNIYVERVARWAPSYQATSSTRIGTPTGSGASGSLSPHPDTEESLFSHGPSSAAGSFRIRRHMTSHRTRGIK